MHVKPVQLKKTGSYHQSCHPSIQFLNIHPSNFHPPFSPSSHPLEKISLNKYNPMKKTHPLVNPFLPSSGSNWGDLCKKYYSILPFQFPSTIFPFLPSFEKISLNKYNPIKKIHPLVNPFLPSSGSNWGDLP